MYKLAKSLFLTSLLLLAGCLYASQKVDRATKLRSIFEADKVLVITSPRNFPLVVSDLKPLSYIGVDRDYDEGRRIMDSYRISDPVRGVKDIFFQSLPPETVQGEIVYQDTPDIDLLQRLNGWVSFNNTYFELKEYPYVGYQFIYEVMVRFRYKSGMINQKGQEYMELLWQKECRGGAPDGFLKGYPISTWLKNNGALLKERIAYTQKKCGKELSQELIKFLEN